MTVKSANTIIIGAGSAGLYALSQARKADRDVLVVDSGPLGTTCARVGCMPSKVLIQVADDLHRRAALSEEGIQGGDDLHPDLSAVLAHVRRRRDGFAGHVAARNAKLGNRLVRGTARFVAPGAIEVDGERIEAKRFILAVGSRPMVPAPWQVLGERLLTTDSLFEQKTLPRRIGVLGLGVIGIELGQALARLGLDVMGVDMLDGVGGVTDPVVRDFLVAAIRREFPLWLGAPADLSPTADGVRIRAGDREAEVDRVLVSLGRRSNLDRLDLAAAEVDLDRNGMPSIDPETMQIAGHPLFVAGDASGARPLLHEAGDEGRIAGYNATATAVRRFRRKPHVGIIFTDPNVATVGADWQTLGDRQDVVVGSRDFATQTRAVVMGRNAGVLRLYGQKRDGRLLGATLAAPHGEHLAHLLAWAIQDGKTVFDLLRHPFYHPVIEEGLQDALYELARQVENAPDSPIELAVVA